MNKAKEGPAALFMNSHKSVEQNIEYILSRSISDRTANSESSNRELVLDLFARMTWSRLSEPGDSYSGSLILRFGALDSLEYLLADMTGDLLCEKTEQHIPDLNISQLRKCISRWRLRVSSAATEKDVHVSKVTNWRVVMPGFPNWPDSLSDLAENVPKLLWTEGNLSNLQYPQVSVVGARAATPYGKSVTSGIVEEICGLDRCVISGAAYGIDGVAHRTCLALNKPTIAILAGGIDRRYPAAHTQLLNDISQHGLILSENLYGTAPTRWRFLMRNRLIAAMSGATIVTEAGVKSGSLNTAGHAAQLGRALGAVPGSIHSSASFGCHKLIREYGAELISGRECIAEFLDIQNELMAQRARVEVVSDRSRLLSIHARVIDALPLRGGRQAAFVAEHAGLSVREATVALAELEALGVVRRTNDDEGWELIRDLKS